jgi:hypothetical protein
LMGKSTQVVEAWAPRGCKLAGFLGL